MQTVENPTVLSEVPEVTVLLPVHNGMPYVEQAVRSMMEQTLRNIEILIVDDASSDETPSVLARLAAQDPRIRIATLAENTRLVGALNHGLNLARAPYVARMDADDISAPDRLEIQKRYLDTHPSVVLCGTSCRYIDARGRVTKVAHRPRDAVMCRWLVRFRIPLLHPTFMFRRLLPDSGPILYTPAYPAEDLAFTARILRHGEIVSLPDVLLDYRVHPASVSNTLWQQQQVKAHEIIRDLVVADLPSGIAAAMEVPLTAFYTQALPDPAAFFDGLRTMLAHDSQRHPAYARWFRRQTAQLAYETLSRTRMSKSRIAWAFLRHGPDFISPLALRLLETANRLPHGLRSDSMVAGGST